MKLISVSPHENYDKAWIAIYEIQGRSPESGNFFTGELCVSIDITVQGNPQFSVKSLDFEINNRPSFQLMATKLAEYLEIIGAGLKKDLAAMDLSLPL